MKTKPKAMTAKARVPAKPVAKKVSKPVAKAASKPVAKKPAAKAAVKTTVKSSIKPAAKAATKPVAKPVAKPIAKPIPKTTLKTTPKTMTKTAPKDSAKTASKPVVKTQKTTLGLPTVSTAPMQAINQGAQMTQSNQAAEDAGASQPITGRGVFAVRTLGEAVSVEAAFLAEDGNVLRLPAVFPNRQYAIEQIDELRALVNRHFDDLDQGVV